MEIGSKLKEARMRTEFTQEQVAEAIGVSRQTVSNWVVSDMSVALPTDAAPGSLALIRCGDDTVTKLLFGDGTWARV